VALAADIRRWDANWALRRWASALPTPPRPAPACRTGSHRAAGRHGLHGAHAPLRAEPRRLLPAGARSSLCVISARMDYRPRGDDAGWIDANGSASATARRQRSRSTPVAATITRCCAPRPAETDRAHRAGGARACLRVCTDSAPVFEVEFARAAGLGWRGKHTLLLAADAGLDVLSRRDHHRLPLAPDKPVSEHCGTCTRCIDACPTRAIVAPYELDAPPLHLVPDHRAQGLHPGRTEAARRQPRLRLRRLPARLPVEQVRAHCRTARLRRAQRPGSRRARHTVIVVGSAVPRAPRGSAILRIGYERWLRNLAVGLGNAPTSATVVEALRARADSPSSLVREHVAWALRRHASEEP